MHPRQVLKIIPVKKNFVALVIRSRGEKAPPTLRPRQWMELSHQHHYAAIFLIPYPIFFVITSDSMRSWTSPTKLVNSWSGVHLDKLTVTQRVK